MNLSEYQAEARKLAVYPRTHFSVIYPALGLGGEASEVLEAVLIGRPWLEIRFECGDVTWYGSSIADDLGLSLDRLDIPFDPFAHSSADRDIYAARVVIAAGKVQELVKKSVRKQLPFNRDQIGEALGKVFGSIQDLARSCEGKDESLEDIFDANIAKLKDRYQQKQVAAA